MKQATIKLETLTCPSCILKIELGLKSIEGVDNDTIKVMFNASKVKVQYEEQKTSLTEIKNSIENLGYKVLNATSKNI